MKPGVGIRSIAVKFPEHVRTNDYFRQNHARVVSEAEQKSLSRVWSPHKTGQEGARDHFNEEMAPFMGDLFRGTQERRVLGSGQSIYELELQVARDALAAANMTPGDVDLMLVTAILPRAHFAFAASAFDTSRSVTSRHRTPRAAQYARSSSSLSSTSPSSSAFACLHAIASSHSRPCSRRVTTKSVVDTRKNRVEGSLGCVRPSAEAIATVSSSGRHGNCSRTSTTRGDQSST